MTILLSIQIPEKEIRHTSKCYINLMFLSKGVSYQTQPSPPNPTWNKQLSSVRNYANTVVT